nr:hypothetical protein [uncultured Chryseobacterium sp.]
MYPLIFTLIILVLLFLKKRRNGEKVSVVYFILPTLVVLLISSMFFFLGDIVGSTAYSYLFSKKYEAKVVKYDYTEGDADSGPNAIAVVEFKNDQNKTIQKSIGYGTSTPIEIGKTIKVSYQEGEKEVRNLSFGEQKLLTGIVLVFFLFFTVALVAVVFYALDRDLAWIWKLVAGLITYIVFPGAMLFFIGILSWVIWEYFQGRKDDMPIWALGICSLFVTLLIPALIGYFKMLFTRPLPIKKGTSKEKIRLSKFSKRIPK